MPVVHLKNIDVRVRRVFAELAAARAVDVDAAWAIHGADAIEHATAVARSLLPDVRTIATPGAAVNFIKEWDVEIRKDLAERIA